MPSHDAALAKAVGADENGMRSLVLALLKSSATPVPRWPSVMPCSPGISRTSNAWRPKEACHPGPMDGAAGWRGMPILAVADIEEAKKLVATDPVIQKAETVADITRCSRPAALMRIDALHATIVSPSVR